MPKIVDHQSKREEVAEATWRVIARQGIEGATVRRIAEEAGCSTTVVTHYYRNKNELLLYAVRLARLRSAHRIEKKMKGAIDRETFREVICDSLPLSNERRLELQVWMGFWAKATSDPIMVDEQRSRLSEARIFFRDLILEAQRNGVIRPELDAAEEAESLTAFVDGLSVHATLEPLHFAPERQVAIMDRYLSNLFVSQ